MATSELNIQFNEQGLIPAVVQDADSGEVLMVAYMNKESLEKTQQTGYTWFYSRSRQQLWQKGEQSGHVQKVRDILIDCDHDTLLVQVTQEGAGACHKGYRSCFHSRLGETEHIQEPTFDAKRAYRDDIIKQLYDVIAERKRNPEEGSYTNYLFTEGINKILKKVGEEAAEVIIAAKDSEDDPLIYESADLLYHLLVLLAERNIDPELVFDELRRRRSGK